MVERDAVNIDVAGSNPASLAKPLSGGRVKFSDAITKEWIATHILNKEGRLDGEPNDR